jgi:hypothetical protein
MFTQFRQVVDTRKQPALDGEKEGEGAAKHRIRFALFDGYNRKQKHFELIGYFVEPAVGIEPTTC